MFYVGSVVADYSFWGMPFNIVPDTTTLRAVSSLGSGNTTPPTLTQGPFSGTQYAESWPTYFLGVSIANTGAGGVAVATGTHFQDAYDGVTVKTWPVQAGLQYVVNLTLPFLTVASVDSDTQCTFTTPYGGAPVSGASFAGPFNMPYPGVVGGDHHQIVATISSTTGLPSKLYEGYNIGSTDGGITWGSTSVGEWDLVTGAQDPDTYGASSAAGIPYWPMMPNGDEVFVQGAIKHALAVTLGGGGTNLSTPYGLGSGGFVFPASMSNQPVGNPGAWLAGGVPLGGRIRLKSSFSISAFMSANPSATAATQAVLTALQTYGAINVDWGGLGGSSIAFVGAADARWIKADVDALQLLPTTSFELVDTVRPRFAITGPASVVYGVQSVWTLTQDPFSIASGAWPGDKDSNYWIGVVVSWSNDAGFTWTAISPSPYGFQATEGQGLGTTPGPFTIDFTPPSAGSYLFQVSYYDSPNFLIPANFAFAATTGIGAAFTSWRSGTWSVPSGTSTSPWYDGGTQTALNRSPGAGDTATINHDVQVTANTTIGDGSNSTVLDVTAILTVTGAALTIRGNATFGYETTLTVQNSGSTSAGLVFDGNTGVAPELSFADYCQLSLTGTASARCSVNTLSTTSGNPGYVTSTGSNGSVAVSAAYCDFARLGTSTVPALSSNLLITTDGFILSHCTIDHCGQLPYASITGTTINFQLTATVWTNAESAYIFAVGANGTPTTGTQLISGCVMMGQGNLSPGNGFTVMNNYMDLPLQINRADVWVECDGNFIRSVAVSDATACGLDGNLTNNFVLLDPPSGSPGTGFLVNYYSCSMTGNVFQYTGTTPGSACMSSSDTSLGSLLWTVANNIVLPSSGSPNGSAGACLWIVDDALSGSTTTQSLVEHNTICCGAGIGVRIGLGAGATKTGALTSLRSNLVWRAGSPLAGAYLLSNTDGSPNTDVVTAANTDYNGWVDLATCANGTISNGTVYNTPMSGATAPGVHDLANVSPAFVDATRNLQSWDASLGGAGTFASARARIQADPTLTKTSLLPYIQTGFTPTTSTYIGTGHNAGGADGKNIGAI